MCEVLILSFAVIVYMQYTLESGIQELLSVWTCLFIHPACYRHQVGVLGNSHDDDGTGCSICESVSEPSGTGTKR